MLLNSVISSATPSLCKAFHGNRFPLPSTHSCLATSSCQEKTELIKPLLKFLTSSVVQWPSSPNWGVSGVNVAPCGFGLQSVSPGGSPPNLSCHLGPVGDWWWGIMTVYVLLFYPIFWCVLVMMLTVVWRSVTEIKAAAAAFFWARWLDLIRSEWVLLLPQRRPRFTVHRLI